MEIWTEQTMTRIELLAILKTLRKWTDTKPISLKDKRKLNPTEKEKTLLKKGRMIGV